MRVHPAVFVCPLILTACGGSATDTDLETAFCELLENGREKDVVATATATDAPEVAFDNRQVEIELVGSPGAYSGYATFTPDEPGHFAMGLGQNVPFEVQTASGEVLPWAAEVVGAACADLAVRYTVELAQVPHTLFFGPGDAEEIDFVAEESNDDLSLATP
ncbi:MAG: hypothetical protein KTR31_35065 [Myxococcales bacterium]|nr:hypothetical protein [Myxococcales bacterium]